jgi:hypothetical protein
LATAVDLDARSSHHAPRMIEEIVQVDDDGRLFLWR